MTRDSINLPATRTWRDIPQPVVPRAMSREGKWRFVMATVRCTAVVAIVGVCGWGVWMVTASLRDDSRAMPAAAKATPMKRPELRTDGVLDDAWLARTLGIPKKASLMELDLQALRRRLLADEQVVSATLTRNFPDRLIVQISERAPIARVRTEWLGSQRTLLVARDGVVFAGSCYEPAVIESLPWLDGVALSVDNGKFRPIEGMDEAAELLGKARVEAEHLYQNWGVISLASLVSDHRIEVRARDGAYVVQFTTRDDFFRQLVKLNYICDQLSRLPVGSKASIDLTLGSSLQREDRFVDVPVMITPPPAEEPAPMPVTRSKTMLAQQERNPAETLRFATPVSLGGEPRSEQAFFTLKPSQPKRNTREF